MITPEEFKQRWGTEDLVSYAPKLINSLNIPEISRQFLLQAGLPRMAYINSSFDLGANTLVPVTEATCLTDRWAYGWREPFPESYCRYRLLGIKSFDAVGHYFNEIFFCLDEQWEGKVVWVFNEPDYPVELLNNSVPQMAEMLLLYEEDGMGRKTLDWENGDECEQYFENMEIRMRNVDTEALENDKGWSEMIYHLLG